MDATNALTTWAIAQTFLSAPAADQTFVEKLIDISSGQINRLTGRLLAARALTEYQDGGGSNLIYTIQSPVNSVTSLYIDTERAWGADTEISSDDYVLTSETGRIFLTATRTPIYPGCVRIIYNGGFAAGPDLSAIEGGCLALVGVLYKTYKDNRMGISGRGVQGANITYYDKKLPDETQNVIDTYRRTIAG